MSHRYFVEAGVGGAQVVLADTEAHHLAHVMRLRPGEQVTLFDGSGREFLARIERVDRREVHLEILSSAVVDRELPTPIQLGAALPKGDRQAWLVEKAVELGVASLTPLLTQRGVAQPVAKALARLRRGVIEASKQCGRNRLMEIKQPEGLLEFLARRQEMESQGSASPAAWLAHPGGEPLAELLKTTLQKCGALLAIGPEGGFAPEEVQAARDAGWRIVDLGPRILRVETAGLLLAGAAAWRLG